MKTIRISDKAYKKLDEKRRDKSFRWLIDEIVFGEVSDLTLGRDEIEKIVENKIEEYRRSR